MSPYANRGWARSWVKDVVAGVVAALAAAVALAGIAVGLALLQGHHVSSAAGPLDLVAIVAGVSLPSGLAGGLAVARAFRHRRAELGGVAMWRARFGGISMVGMLCGTLATFAAFPVLMPACDHLRMVGEQHASDPFLLAVLAMLSAGGFCGAVATSCAMMLRRPTRL
jgi:hypothetical protein